MMRKVIITAAVAGSRPTREMNPATPYSPQEIAEAAVDSWRAGASITHIHVRDPKTGAPDFKMDYFIEVMERIRKQCDIIINLTTSGLRLTGPNMIEERLQPVTLRPEICSFDLGSLNFQDKVFYNPPEWGEAAPKRMREYDVKPEIEVFDVGHIYQAIHYIERGLIENPPYFQLCMGTRWGIEATPENLLFMKSKLPSDARWSVLGVGRAQLQMITMAILLGGNIRVGFEDNIYLREGVLAKSNAQFVKMAANLVTSLQCEVATPNEARDILGLKH
jgi:3-keto-5-aminohexanoate cleavage enzyme